MRPDEKELQSAFYKTIEKAKRYDELLKPHHFRDDRLHCSFCGKSQDNVEILIAGGNVYICDECVGLCVDLVLKKKKERLAEGKTIITDIDEK
jgi:hypothetical protein